MPPFSQVSISPYLMSPSWELQGGDQSLLLPVGVGTDWGLAPGPYLILWPFLVSWSVPPVSPSGGSATWRVGTPGWKRTRNTIRWHASSFILGFLCSSPAKPPVWRLKGSAWLESCWGLQKCCRNQWSRNQAPHLESWRTQVYYAGGPRGVNLQALSPEQRGY